MEQKPKTGKFALNYGIILGAISITFGLMLYFMDMHYQGGIAIGVVSVAITLAVIIAVMLGFKKANGGYMSFAEGLKLGVGTALIGGIIGILFNLILSNVIDPEMSAKAMQVAEAQFVEQGLNKEQIDANLEMAKKFQAPWIQAAFGLIGSIFLGFVLSLIPALVMKKTQSDY
ncbi:DUF4199 domain-containing protein [Robertkochia sediminum]|uniref:DUF4199 domain-containing protein n=1 Tax=Robertkochia sediminum TaxID=2785326 RepID=UPI00193322C0|nr:DUF4199 domain-containing protein [Robertkochia sediminum]MBL7473124.1 DUF4199 domain-containing protein [Robertkochia sediminum]